LRPTILPPPPTFFFVLFLERTLNLHASFRQIAMQISSCYRRVSSPYSPLFQSLLRPIIKDRFLSNFCRLGAVPVSFLLKFFHAASSLPAVHQVWTDRMIHAEMAFPVLFLDFLVNDLKRRQLPGKRFFCFSFSPFFLLVPPSSLFKRWKDRPLFSTTFC